MKLNYQGLPLDCSKSNDHTVEYSDEINREDENDIDLHEDETRDL